MTTHDKRNTILYNPGKYYPTITLQSTSYNNESSLDLFKSKKKYKHYSVLYTKPIFLDTI